MITFIRVPYEGCLWSAIEQLTPDEFRAAAAAEEKPCALGWAYEWVGKGEHHRPVGVVYDYVIQRANERRGTDYSPWRMIGE